VYRDLVQELSGLNQRLLKNNLEINTQASRFNTFPRKNNLEWLRLIFALQVVFSHSFNHLQSTFKFPCFIGNFPGVPAFFFVSGFLIYSSYLNSPGYRYFENRFLRLFPGLVTVTMGGVWGNIIRSGMGKPTE